MEIHPQIALESYLGVCDRLSRENNLGQDVQCGIVGHHGRNIRKLGYRLVVGVGPCITVVVVVYMSICIVVVVVVVVVVLIVCRY